MKTMRFLAVLLVLFAVAAIPSAAAPLAAPCTTGWAYDPACDVDHDGDVDIYDIQLTASHWGQAGAYSIYPAMVPKTGQTTSYAAGDDGDLQNGVPWPNSRFTDNLNGTVTDNLIGLIWLKDANCAFVRRDWTTALTDVASLNTTGAMNSRNCGDISNGGSYQTDWRLPNVQEQQSLVDYGRINPALPSDHPFTDVQPLWYWTSNTYRGYPSIAWFVYLGNGYVGNDQKTIMYFVWPVRGG